MTVARGVEEGRAALAMGEPVVVVDGPEALSELLLELGDDGLGRLHVLVGDAGDEAVLRAAAAMAEELFHRAS